MDNKEIKKYSTSLVNREMHIETTMRYNKHTTKWLILVTIIVRDWQYQVLAKNVDQLAVSHLFVGSVNWCKVFGTLKIFSTTEHTHMQWSSIFTSVLPTQQNWHFVCVYRALFIRAPVGNNLNVQSNRRNKLSYSCKL